MGGLIELALLKDTSSILFSFSASVGCGTHSRQFTLNEHRVMDRGFIGVLVNFKRGPRFMHGYVI